MGISTTRYPSHEATPVERGQLLGTVLRRADDRTQPPPLRVRSFFTADRGQRSTPRATHIAAAHCPPGPGYWPIDAPSTRSAMGWRNPTHVLANRAFAGAPPEDAEVIVATGAGDMAELWSLPSDRSDAQPLGNLPLSEGDRYRLLSIATGREASRATSAEGYRLWYRLALPEGESGWVQAAVSSNNDTGSNGRPSSVRFDFLLASAAD